MPNARKIINIEAIHKAFILFSIILIYGCSHPIEIVGKGDVLTATGTRNCYLEDYQAGKQSCTENKVYGTYQETYYAEPRPGWEFDRWLNYCTDSQIAECSFFIKAETVKKFYGDIFPPLVAVFKPTFDTVDRDENVSFSTAKLISEQGLTRDTATSTRDADFFKFVAAESADYSVLLEFSQPNISLYLYNDNVNKTLVGESRNTGETTQSINRKRLEKGKTYYLGVQAIAQSSLQTYKLTLTRGATPVDPNKAPVARAGSGQSVTVGSPVSLDGSGSSDPEGDSLSYRWVLEKPASSAARLSAANTAWPSFNVDVAGTYTAKLTVSDGKLQSTSSVRVTATEAVNNPPTAMARADKTQANVTDVITLSSAGSSDPEGKRLSYAWELTRPTGSVAALSGATQASPTFTVDVVGSYTATLRVNDGEQNSETASVTVRAEALIDGEALFSEHCLGCHTASELKGKTLANINDASMRRALTDEKLNAIVAWLEP